MPSHIPVVPRKTPFLGVFAVAVALTPASAQEASNPRPAYSSAALEMLVADAARINAHVPEQLHSYRAAVETEMSIVLIDSAGRERTAQLEQIASEVRWRAEDRYDQRVAGYRTQSIGPTVSLMNMFGGWTTPTLYGNRLRLGITPKAVAGLPADRGTTAGMTTHPLSPARETFYTFAGGDTAVVLFSRGRRIPVVRVRVTPRADVAGDAILFDGDLLLDAERKQIAGMRGRLLEIRGGRPVTAGSRLFGAGGTTFIDLVNSEVDGEFWLPATQRTEFHARVAVVGQFRLVVRIASRFSDYRANDSSWVAADDGPGVRHNLTFAPADELGRYAAWQQPIGAANADAHHSDFDVYAPAGWGLAADADRGLHFAPETVADVFRFNRVEGLYTGAAVARVFGDTSPVTVRGSLGWAWAESTPRGALSVARRGTDWTSGVRLQRSLAHTNDFQLPLSWGATLSALFGSVDDYDYLDRRSATVFAERPLGLQRRSVLRFELGAISDEAVEQNISRGLFVEGEGFRPNRGIWPGSYARTAATLELNPHVSGMFVDRGLGARLHYERADGQLRWQRVEARAAVRRELGPLELYARADAGALFGEPPPQTLFEIGRGEGLSAYGYKEFAGDRAAMLRAVAGYNFPVLRAPIQITGGFFAPGLAPGISAGIHTAWTDVSSQAAQRALFDLGVRPGPDGVLLPVSRVTDGVRGSAEVLLTFFSGAAGIGVTRPIDHSAPWRLTARIGQAF